jgi:hypothetical protein
MNSNITRKLLLLFLSLIFCISVFSQNENQYAGEYIPTESSGEPAGFLNLFLMPSHVYAFAFFGGIEYGMWKSSENTISYSIILQPDTSMNESVYMFARYNENIKDISLQFDGFSDAPAIYSFDNENNDSVMHPVFNPNPNCLDYPQQIHFDRGEHKNIQIVSFADVKSEYPKDRVTHTVYTFLLDTLYNDFKLLLNPKKANSLESIKGLWKNGILTLGRGFDSSFKKINEIAEIGEEDLAFLNNLPNLINKPIKDYDFGARDDYGNWVKTTYPMIPYVKKEVKTVSFDTENLFDSSCN